MSKPRKTSADQNYSMGQGKSKVTPVASIASTVRGAIISRRVFFLLSVCILVLSTALQVSGLWGDAVIDDKRLISDFQGRGCGADPTDCFKNMMFGFYYRPVLSASVALGQKLHDNRPIWFHAENLILHIVVVALAIWLFRLLFGRKPTALVAGLLYGVHPIQVCITTFVGGRTDTIVTGFAILFAIGIRIASRRMALSRHTSAINHSAFLLNGFKIAFWIAVAMVSLLGAAFTKEQVLPLVLLAPLFALPVKMNLRQSVKKTSTLPPYWTALFLIPPAIFVIAAKSALHDVDFVSPDWSTAFRAEMVGRTLWSYTRILIFPTVSTLHVTTLGPWEPSQWVVAIAGYAAAIAWVYLAIKSIQNRPCLILILWASLGIFSCFNVVPIPTQFASPYRAGISLFGFAGVAGSLIGSLLANFAARPKSEYARYVPIGCLAAASLWLCVVTVQDVPNWSDEYNLMKAEVSADPNFICARAALGSMQSERGLLEAANSNFYFCLKQLFGSVTPDAYAEILQSGAADLPMRSASTLRYRALQYAPQVVRETGRNLLKLHRPQDAIAYLKSELKISPADNLAREALVTCYRDLHEDAKAEAVRTMDDILLGHPL